MSKRFLTLAGLALLLASPFTFAAETPKSILWEETGPFEHVDGTGPHRTSHNLLMHHRNQANIASAPNAVSQDIGNVAVIVDNGSIIIQPRPANSFDLPVPSAIRFERPVTGSLVSGKGKKASGKGKKAVETQTLSDDSFSVFFSTVGIDGTFGSNLGLGDDDTTEVTFSAGFPFLGTTHTSIFVNSDGNITLGEGDDASTPRDAARLIGGPPRVAPLLVDLDPSSGASVHADARSDRLVVTWSGVPEFGVSNSNTFQAVLHDDGSIDLVYDNIDAAIGVVGVAEGADEGPLNEIDLTADLPDTFGAGAIFEEFTPAVTAKGMDVIALAKEFYKTHEDKYDFLVMFTDFIVDIGFGAFAFHQGIQNQTLGLGLRGTFDATDVIGPDIDELESILNMNRIGLYWPDANKMLDPPIKKFRFFRPPGATLDGPPGADQISRRARRFGTLNGDFGFFGEFTLGLNSAMSIMGQEAGHRWLALPLFVHPTKGFNFDDNFDLLGRGFAHWSFFFNVTVPPGQFGGDPRASSMEGNAITDLGGGLFLTERDELIDGYTELDQYFMGVRLASDVSGIFYVDDPSLPDFVRSFAAQDDIVFAGTRVDLAVSDITATQGALETIFGAPPGTFARFGSRVPAIGDEVDDCGVDVKTMAFIVLIEQGPPTSSAHASAISQVDIFRATWEVYANGSATGGRGLFDTSLDPDCF